MPKIIRKICANCKKDLQSTSFYLHPKTKETLPICKECANKLMDNPLSVVNFFRDNDILFDKDLYDNAIAAAKKDNSPNFFGYYMRMLNMRKGVLSQKGFDESSFDENKLLEKALPAPAPIEKKRTNYCRRCGKDLSLLDFYVSPCYLDSNGLLSICKDCVRDLFASFYQTHGTVDCALYEACAALGYEYSPDAVEKVVGDLNEKIGQSNDDESTEEEKSTIIVDTEDVFGKYLSACSSLSSDHKYSPFDFYGPRPEGYEDHLSAVSVEEQLEIEREKKEEDPHDLWGAAVDDDEIAFLEREHEKWAKKDLTDPAVSLLIRQLCLLLLDMEQKRKNKETPNSKDYGSLTSLLDKAGALPDKASVSGQKGQKTWGEFIELIEKEHPAEFTDRRKKKFLDVNHLDQYYDVFLRKPLKNFILGSRDFSGIVDGTKLQSFDETPESEEKKGDDAK